MRGTHRYILEPYNGTKSRYTCPACHKKGKFSRYIDTQTGEYVGELYGKCDRLIKCNYHKRPAQDHFNSYTPHTTPILMGVVNNSVNKVKKPSYISKEQFLSHIPIHLAYEAQLAQNPFLQYLHSLFNTQGEGEKIVSGLIKQYYIGTGDKGQTLFFQLDLYNKVRTAKIMSYDATTGKRMKSKGAYWLHTSLPDFNLVQCLFGEHLLRKHATKTVAIVESEKTAIIASVYLPQYNWLACGSLQNLKAHKYATILQGKHIILFPDLSAPAENRPSAYELWEKESKQFDYAVSIQVSTLLEELATPTQKEYGLDIADFLVQFDYKAYQSQFSNQESSKPTKIKPFIPIEDYQHRLREENGILLYNGYPATWDLTSDAIDKRTKQLIRLCDKNILVLKLMKELQLEIQV